MKEKKRSKKKIGVGSLVKAKVRNMEENTREGGIRSMRKDVVGFVQSLVGKNEFLFKFEYGQKRDMGSCLLVYVCSKQEVWLDMDEPISDLPEKEQG